MLRRDFGEASGTLRASARFRQGLSDAFTTLGQRFGDDRSRFRLFFSDADVIIVNKVL